MKTGLKWFLYLLFGSWALAMLFGSLIARLVVAVRPGRKRVCPKCGYRNVVDVVIRAREKRDGEPLAYARCTACQRRYKHWGDGPFHSVSDDEWSTLGVFGNLGPPPRH